MIDLASASVETFTPFVGDAFEAVFTDGRLPLKLAEARSLGEAPQSLGRAPFVLTFHGAPGLRLPQHVYPVEHATLGRAEIFLVQIAANATVTKFEAVFG